MIMNGKSVIVNHKERIMLKTPNKLYKEANREKNEENNHTDLFDLQVLKNEASLLRTPVKRNGSAETDDFNKHTPPKRKRDKHNLRQLDQMTPMTSNKDSEKSPLKQQFETPNQKKNIQIEDEEMKGSDCQKMLEALNVTTITRPVCRETEVEHINNFLCKHIKVGKAGSLYITGPPGTGKTACVMHCLHTHKVKKNETKVHVLNCMTVKTGHTVFKQIAKEFNVNISRKSSHAICEALKLYFTRSGPMIILVMDEMDRLETRHQETLYNIFEWATLPNSRLILIGIANALEPLEHSLPQLQVWKVHKPSVLQFQPYKKEQIKAIIEDRLQVCKEDSDLVLRPEVIEYCSRNAASHNGDVRKALAMLSQAMIVVMNSNKPNSSRNNKKETESVTTKLLNNDKESSNPERLQVRLHHVQKVATSVSSSVSSLDNSIVHLPLQQKILIFCLTLLLKKNSRNREIAFGKLEETYLHLCRKQQLSTVDGGELLSLCSQLEDFGIITMKKKKQTHQTKLSLQVDEMDLEPLLKQEKLIMNMFNDKSLKI